MKSFLYLTHRLKAFLLAATLLVQPAFASHGTNNAGREFLFSFLPGGSFPAQDQLVEVHLTADTATDVLVEYPIIQPRFQQTFAVAPGAVTIATLPVEAVTGWTPNTPLDNGVHLVANSPFAAVLVTSNSTGQSGGMALALPVGVLNTQYIVATYNSANDVPSDHAVFTVTAVYNNTTVSITPSSNLSGNGGSKGVPFSVILNRGESYMVEDEKPNPGGGLAGSIVSSDKPVSVSNGNICTKILAGVNFCDMLFEIAAPVQEWGTDFFVRNVLHRGQGSVYRVLASQDNTVVTRDGVQQGSAINRGQFVDIGPFSGTSAIAGNKPVFAVQLMTGIGSPSASSGGDPAMANISAIQNYGMEYEFSVSSPNITERNFITIFVNKLDAGHLTLDGEIVDITNKKLWIDIPGSNYAAGNIEVNSGIRRVASRLPIWARVLAYHSNQGFAYPGGLLLRPINPLDDTVAPLCSVSPFSSFDKSAAGSATDSGIGAAGLFFIELLPGSVNLALANVAGADPGAGIAPFEPGTDSVTYTVSVIDPAQPASGIVRLTDGSGNSCESVFVIGEILPTPHADHNPPSCAAEPFSPASSRISVIASDDRPTEDVNGNGILDPGEDLNGDSGIDADSGIVQFELLPGSVNLVPGSDSFLPGAARLRYGAELINRFQPGSGVLRVTDGGGNICELDISLDGQCPPDPDPGPPPDPDILDTKAIEQRDAVVRLARRLRGKMRKSGLRLISSATNIFQSSWTSANTVPFGASSCPAKPTTLTCSLLDLSAVKGRYLRNARRFFRAARRAITLLEQTGDVSPAEAQDLLSKQQRRLNGILSLAGSIPESTTLCTQEGNANIAGAASSIQ